MVQEYVATAQPVGSKTVVENYGLNVSSATIRNEMKALEEQGYLTHPHTSAGRVPTEEGYRYFVQHLLPERPLSVEERRMIRHQFHQARQELDQWARLAAAVLAHSARMAALATPARAERCRFKHLELIEVREGLALMVLVLEQGLVRQQMLTLDYPISQDELSRVSNQLNDLLRGKEADQITIDSEQLSPTTRLIGEVVRNLMEQEDHVATSQIYREGLSHMLEQPEFASGENVQQVVAVLETSPVLSSILSQVRRREGVQVLIAGEGRYDILRDVSLVLSRYGVSRGASGVLGVVGPVRMPYSQTIPLVRYVSKLMSEMIQDWYG